MRWAKITFSPIKKRLFMIYPIFFLLLCVKLFSQLEDKTFSYTNNFINVIKEKVTFPWPSYHNIFGISFLSIICIFPNLSESWYIRDLHRNMVKRNSFFFKMEPRAMLQILFIFVNMQRKSRKYCWLQTKWQSKLFSSSIQLEISMQYHPYWIEILMSIWPFCFIVFATMQFLAPTFYI